MVMIRSAIPFTSASHCSLSVGLPKTSDTILAPWMGARGHVSMQGDRHESGTLAVRDHRPDDNLQL